jgi:hypothetical protein
MEGEDEPRDKAHGSGIWTMKDMMDAYRAYEEVHQNRPQDPSLYFFKGLCSQVGWTGFRRSFPIGSTAQ